MANASKRIETRDVKKIVQVEEKFVDLTLTWDEAEVVRTLVGSAYGNLDVNPILSAIFKALGEAGVPVFSKHELVQAPRFTPPKAVYATAGSIGRVADNKITVDPTRLTVRLYTA